MAQSLATKNEIKIATLIGVVAGLLADADILIRSSSDPLLNIEYHRYYSHSLAFIPVGAAIAIGDIAEPGVSYDRSTRDTAFRRIVTEVYDYRCAATGIRIVLPGALIMVEAAHLIPFSDSQDEDPGNGIAFTSDPHWALDRNIIAPGPDLKWHVSKLVDSRIADNRPFIKLDGQDILLPRDKRFWPREDALARRWSQLRRV